MPDCGCQLICELGVRRVLEYLQLLVRGCEFNCEAAYYSRTSMARTLMAHSLGLARTITLVNAGHFWHNPPWMSGTTLGYN